MKFSFSNQSICLSFSFFTLMAWLLVSCESGFGYSDRRSSEQDSALNRIDDSLYVMSPNAIQLVENGMRQAKDSISYYEYDVRKGVISGLYFKSDSSIINARQILQFAERQHPQSLRVKELMGRCYANIGSHYFAIKINLDSALYHYNLAYKYISESGNLTNLCDICANIADTYAQKNDMVMCASWYRRGLFLVDSLHLPEISNISIYLGLAQTYTYLRDFKTAQYYYQQTERRLNALRPNMRIFFVNNYGNFFYFKQDYLNALRQFQRLEKLLDRYGMDNSIDMKICRLNMADVFLNLNKTDSAEVCLKGLNEYFRAQNFDAGIYYVNTIRIALDIREGRVKEAKRLIENERMDDMTVSSMQDIRNRYVREFYIRTGDYKRAYDNYVRCTRQNDSVEKSKSYVRSAEIMMRFSQDTLALHKQINIDAKEKQVKNMYIWLIVSVAVILILALLILTGVFYMRKRRLQSDFDLLQMRLENIRNRISPHFIFNVLNHEIDKQDERTAKELMTMTHLIRDGLNISHKPYISLFEEIGFVKRYVYIENQILGEDFVCHVDVPADDVLRQVCIPSMFIQILVENSIKHGLKMKQGIKRLSIKIDCTDVSTAIQVRDNGIGFSAVHNPASSTRTGLNVIRQTILIVNARNSRKMRFNINNITDENQHVAGCMATLVIPVGIKL